MKRPMIVFGVRDYRNGFGVTRYQPYVGGRSYSHVSSFGESRRMWTADRNHGPVLYRSRQRALNKARRRWRSERRHDWQPT